MNLVIDTSFRSTVSASPQTCRVVQPLGTIIHPHMHARDKKKAREQLGHQ